MTQKRNLTLPSQGHGFIIHHDAVTSGNIIRNSSARQKARKCDMKETDSPRTNV